MSLGHIPGVWLKPELGQRQLLRDLSMVRTPNGTFHLVWTTSWKGDMRFGYANSKDLIHWSEQQMIPVMTEEPTTVNVWAPEIFYDEDSERLMVISAYCIPGRFERGIEEENNNHRLYYISLRRTLRLFLKRKSCMIRDSVRLMQFLVKRDKNDYVMVLKDNTRPERNLKIAFADSLTDILTCVATIYRIVCRRSDCRKDRRGVSCLL